MSFEQKGRALGRPGRSAARMRLVMTAAILVVGLGFAWILLGRHPKTVAPPPVAPPGTFRPTDQQWTSLTLETVKPIAFETAIHAEGRIAAADTLTTQVFSPVSGRVLRVIAHAGDSVRKGAPLAELAGVDYDQASGDLSAAATQVRGAQANEQRLAQLYKEQGASLKDWQQSQTDLATAENALQNARARLHAMGLADPDIRGLEGRAPGRAGPFVLRAPISGVIIQQAIGPGQTVASLNVGGAAALYSVSDLSRVWLVGALRDTDAAQARLGQPVEARPVGDPATVLLGRVDYISPTLDPASRRVAVRATIANPHGALRPETFLDFAVITHSGDQALAIPAEAVIYEGSQAHVWVADPARHLLMSRAIEPGRSSQGMVEVRSGLRPSEPVVTRSALFIDQAAKAE